MWGQRTWVRGAHARELNFISASVVLGNLERAICGAYSMLRTVLLSMYIRLLSFKRFRNPFPFLDLLQITLILTTTLSITSRFSSDCDLHSFFSLRSSFASEFSILLQRTNTQLPIALLHHRPHVPILSLFSPIRISHIPIVCRAPSTNAPRRQLCRRRGRA